MQMPFFLIGFLIVVVMVVVGIAGLVLLIVGLATKRKALWGSGLATMLLSGIVVCAAGGWGVHRVFQKVAEFREGLHIAAVSDSEMRSWFSENADVELPGEVVLLNGTSITVLPTSTYFMKIDVPDDFGAFLEEHFGSETSWSGVEEHFDLSWLDKEEKAAISFWNLPEIKQCSFFCGGHPEHPDATYIAYDKEKGIAYVVGEQGWN